MKFLEFRNMACMTALAVMGVAFTACDDDEITPAKEGIYPSEVEMVLPEEVQPIIYTDESGTNVLPMLKGETFKLDVILRPENVTFNDVIWESTNPDNVAVDQDGNVTALSGADQGFSIVTVSPDPYVSGAGYTASLRVVVSDVLIPATEITLSAPADELYATETMQLSASIAPDNTTYRTVKWTSSNEKVATVDQTCLVTGIESDAIQATVVITATALDGSGVSASKTLTVNKIVAPESVTIDQKYAKGNYDCAINEQGLTLDFATVPASATQTLLVWESSDPSIATVENGVVTYNKDGVFGDVTITATCPGTGNKGEITLSLPAGLHRELFHNPDYRTWGPTSGRYDGEWSYGKLAVTAPGTGKLRQDFKSWETTYLCAGNYPIVAIKIDDLKDLDEVTGRNITLDASGRCDGKDFKGGLNGNNNKWLHDYKCSDGSHVFIYDLTTQGFATGGVLPAASVASFATFQFKYADIVSSVTPLVYNVYWVQTFKSQDDVDRYLTDVDGLTFEVIK